MQNKLIKKIKVKNNLIIKFIQIKNLIQKKIKAINFKKNQTTIY